MTFALVHSPLVGPTTWRAVAGLLRAAVESVVIPELAPDVFAEPPFLPAIQRAFAAGVDAAAAEGPVVLTGHSGAGPLLPGIAVTMHTPVRAVVYVDAMLPEPGRSWFDRASDELEQHVRGLARHGLLPPWDEWFERGAVEDLIPRPELLARFRAELPRVPLSYFAEPAPDASWAGPSAYLLLSDAYRGEAAQARRDGWPVSEVPGHHLSMLTEPRSVADALVDLVLAATRSEQAG